MGIQKYMYKELNERPWPPTLLTIFLILTHAKSRLFSLKILKLNNVSFVMKFDIILIGHYFLMESSI